MKLKQTCWKATALMTGALMAVLVGCSNPSESSSSNSRRDKVYVPPSSQYDSGRTTTTTPQQRTYPLPNKWDTGGQLRGSYSGRSNVTQGNYRYVATYLEKVVLDLDKAWSQWFRSVGLREPMVGYRIINRTDPPFVSRCGGLTVTHDYPNAFYCDADRVTIGGVTDRGMMILPVTAFYKMWSGDYFGRKGSVGGDFGAAGIVAHEFGHHVQAEISAQLGFAAPRGKNAELIGDCFAGNWADDLYKRNGMTDQDLIELVDAINAIGDPTTSGDHGTGVERVRALKIGFGGYPQTCLKAYWPEAVS